MAASTIVSLFRGRATVVWACFVVATVASWWLGTHVGSGSTAAVGVLAIGGVKACFVGLEFMELRHAPRWLQVTFGGWLLVVVATLTALIVV